MYLDSTSLFGLSSISGFLTFLLLILTISSDSPISRNNGDIFLRLPSPTKRRYNHQYRKDQEIYRNTDTSLFLLYFVNSIKIMFSTCLHLLVQIDNQKIDIPIWNSVNLHSMNLLLYNENSSSNLNNARHMKKDWRNWSMVNKSTEKSFSIKTRYFYILNIFKKCFNP